MLRRVAKVRAEDCTVRVYEELPKCKRITKTRIQTYAPARVRSVILDPSDVQVKYKPAKHCMFPTPCRRKKTIVPSEPAGPVCYRRRRFSRSRSPSPMPVETPITPHRTKSARLAKCMAKALRKPMQTPQSNQSSCYELPRRKPRQPCFYHRHPKSRSHSRSHSPSCSQEICRPHKVKWRSVMGGPFRKNMVSQVPDSCYGACDSHSHRPHRHFPKLRHRKCGAEVPKHAEIQCPSYHKRCFPGSMFHHRHTEKTMQPCNSGHFKVKSSCHSGVFCVRPKISNPEACFLRRHFPGLVFRPICTRTLKPRHHYIVPTTAPTPNQKYCKVRFTPNNHHLHMSFPKPVFGPMHARLVTNNNCEKACAKTKILANAINFSKTNGSNKKGIKSRILQDVNPDSSTATDYDDSTEKTEKTSEYLTKSSDITSKASSGKTHKFSTMREAVVRKVAGNGKTAGGTKNTQDTKTVAATKITGVLKSIGGAKISTGKKKTPLRTKGINRAELQEYIENAVDQSLKRSFINKIRKLTILY